jgi:hypothetical protein
MNKTKLKSFVADKETRKILGKSKMQKPLTDEIAQLLTNLEQHSTNMRSYVNSHNEDLGKRCDYHLGESYFLQICDKVVIELYAKEISRPIIDVLLQVNMKRDSFELFKELFNKDYIVREAIYFFKNQTLDFEAKIHD